MKKIFFLFALLVTSVMSMAAIVDTVTTYSLSMKKDIKAVVIRPQNYDALEGVPVVYLLHGYSDNYSGWITKAPGIAQLADQYGIMIVCPDGGYGSWYWDSMADPAFKYETYIASELVQWVDSKYRTIKNRKGRAITGLSMGGHGALYLAIKHLDVFGAAGSMSGGVDIRPFPNNWEISKRLGEYSAEPARWEQNTVINMLHLLNPKSLKLMIDCGTGDFFYAVNEKLHQEMIYRNIPHDYISRPGAHNWPYWQNAIKYQLVFMNDFFRGG